MSSEKPGTFGNRCNRCGSYLDDGLVCNCYDHQLNIDLRPKQEDEKCKCSDRGPCICRLIREVGISLPS